MDPTGCLICKRGALQIRAVRDKLPRGHYVVVASLLSRLGGTPVAFAGGHAVTSARTRPIAHLGRVTTPLPPLSPGAPSPLPLPVPQPH